MSRNGYDVVLMLSRRLALSMTPKHWDVFCHVVDNFGDLGVCWRLARQLRGEYGLAVRLWIDDLPAFQLLCPAIDPARPTQNVQGVEIRRWAGDLADAVPGEVVVETFACRLPERFEHAMSVRHPQPVWLNLDYLSAEEWVAACHTRPSPHPRWPLVKYFFFPGFSEDTGGLLRESDLLAQREAYLASREAQADFWGKLAWPAPAPDALRISLFSYENPALDEFLEIWAAGERPICCLAPTVQKLPAIERFAGHACSAKTLISKGELEIRVLPFVSPPAYDRLLWSCELNFVRGEDSFVRAQWAGKPMLWQIYPQRENAHLVKLHAFLGRYGAALPPEAAATLNALFLAWNGAGSGKRLPELWRRWLEIKPELDRHALDWQRKLAGQEDLGHRLVHFCRSKAIISG